jgi:hypothetical protein
MLGSFVSSDNGTATENELEALINKRTLSKKEGAVWVTRWNGFDAELTRE